MTNGQNLELCILEGEQAGARAPIRAGKAVVIGGGLDGDIILRDEQLNDKKLQLCVNNGTAQLKVLVGFVETQGQKLKAGNEITIKPQQQIKVGQTVLAYTSHSESNAEENNVHQLNVNEKRTQQSGKKKTAKAGKSYKTPKAIPQKALIIGALAFVVSVSLITLSAYSEPSQPIKPVVVKSQIEISQEIEKALHGAGLTGLTVKNGSAKNFIVSGNLETKKQREFLDQILADMNKEFKVKVVVGEQLATTVEEVFRINGISAKVKYQGPGKVEASTVEADVAKLDRVVNVAKRDIVGLNEIILQNTKPEKPVVEPKIDNDPGKRIASVVPGNPAYLITVDGARYFVGAMMPTGHQISAILDQKVSLSKNGKTTTLEF